MNLNLGDTQLIISEAKKRGLLRNQVAYVLATAFWETARTMKPVREYGGEAYLKSKKYYPYVGMGYVQLTWDYNYKKAGQFLGVDFISNPKLLLEPKYAVPILIQGMQEGWFTSKKLADYITLQKSDFVGARPIINGTDKAAEIAKIAREYDADLKRIGYGEAVKSDPAPLPVETKPVINGKPAAKPDEKPAEENKSSNHIPALVSLAIALGFGLWGWLISLPCKVLGAFCGG